MLTVKVTKTVVDGQGKRLLGHFSTKIVEAVEVDIHILRPGELYEVAGLGRLSSSMDAGDNSFAYYIAHPSLGRPDGFADEVDFWDSAYIENSAGKTTEVVRFRLGEPPYPGETGFIEPKK